MFKELNFWDKLINIHKISKKESMIESSKIWINAWVNKIVTWILR